MIQLRVTAFSYINTILLVLFSFGFTGCKADSNYFSASTASVGSGGGTSADGAGYRVRLKARTGVDAFMHKFGDINSACEIPLADTGTPQSIQCMLNMMEYDLWFYGFEYEFNVPKQTCKFVQNIPNRHYFATPGAGPVSATMTTVDGAITACVIDGVAGTIGGGVCTGSEGEIVPSGAVSCVYNYLAVYPTVKPALPNCCTGTSTVVVTAITNTPDGATTVINTVNSRPNGLASSCVESPHDHIATWPKTSQGKATDMITDLGDGPLVRSTKVPSAFSTYVALQRPYSESNFLNAGFHDWTTYAASPATWDTTRTIPRSFQPKFDRGPLGDHVTSATAISDIGDGSEDFRCLNSAGEVKLRIRLYVNEWNTVEDYQAYKTSGLPASGDPTVRGVSGVNCSALNLGPSCNTIWGFDDMLNEFGGGMAAYEFPQEWTRSSPP